MATNQNPNNQAGFENLDSLQSNPYINNANNASFNGNASNTNAQNAGFSNTNNAGNANNAQGLNNVNASTNGFNNASNTNAQNPSTSAISSFFNSGNSQQDFLKGAFIGAVATFILTNKDAQKAIFKGFAKISSLFEMGVEELKERYEDAKAEVDAK